MDENDTAGKDPHPDLTVQPVEIVQYRKTERPTGKRTTPTATATPMWKLIAGAAASLVLVAVAWSFLKPKRVEVVASPNTEKNVAPVNVAPPDAAPVVVGPTEGWSVQFAGAGLTVDGKPLQAGMRIGPKTILRNLSTVPARFQSEEKIRVTLDAGAELAGFTSEKSGYQADVLAGRVFVEYFHSPLETNRKPLSFACGKMFVFVTGTRFGLERFGDTSVVSVADGSVEARNLNLKAKVAVRAREQAIVSGYADPERRAFDPAQTLTWVPEGRGGAWNLIVDGGFDSGKAAWFDNDISRRDEWEIRALEAPGGNALYRVKKPDENPRLRQAVESLEVGAKYRLSYRFRIDVQANMGWGGLCVSCETHDGKTLHAKSYPRLRAEQPTPTVEVVKAGVWQERSVEFMAQSERVRVMVGLDGDLLLTAAVDDIRLVKIK